MYTLTAYMRGGTTASLSLTLNHQDFCQAMAELEVARGRGMHLIKKITVVRPFLSEQIRTIHDR